MIPLTTRHGTYTEEVNSETANAIDPHDNAIAQPSVPWYVRRSGSAWLLLVTAVIGMVATIVLVYERVQLWMDPNHVTSCDISPWVSCGDVMQSWQATLFGFPNQFIGLVAFSVVITTAMALFARAQFSRWFWLWLNIGVFLGFAFCIWLWSQSVYVISVLCLYCMVVWAAMIPMFVLLTVRNMVSGVIPVSYRVRSLATMLAWPVIVLLYVGVLATVMVRFSNAFF